METIVAVILLGIAFTATLTAIVTLVRVSGQNREKAKAGVALQTYAEQVKQPVENGMVYVPCETKANFQTRLNALIPNPEYTITVERIRYWDGSAFQDSGCTQSVPSTDTLSRDKGLQQVMLKVTWDGLDEKVPVVVRDRRCPVAPTGVSGYVNADAGPC